MAPDVRSYLDDLTKPVRQVTKAIIEKMSTEGCRAYVKTIYVGFNIADEMVAAAYGHSKQVEVALALPEDRPDTRCER